MDKNAIKKYAVWARNELIARVTQKAEQYEITEQKITPADADSIGGRVLTAVEKKQRQLLIDKINQDGFEQVIEEVAYTWFNRFTALRFMEVNNYLPSHTRVFTNENGEFKPQILADAIELDLDGLDMDKVYELKNANKAEELYKYLLITQCNALSAILPRMFQKIEHYTELLLPDYLLREGSVIEQMIALIPEENWTDQIQIIGWLYQYYNTEPKDAVFAALKKNVKISKENIPAATQLFTPDWIVRYMVENSLGRLWLEGHPNDSLKSEWKYYLDETEQEVDVQKQLKAIRKDYAELKPEEIRCIDPCMGSGHILCYMFDVLVKIYEDYGYTSREAVENIVTKNLWGLDIDERAAQLAYFAIMMKARQYDRHFFSRNIQPHMSAICETNCIKDDYASVEREISLKKEYQETLDYLINVFVDAKGYGSILQLDDRDYVGLQNAWQRISNITENTSMTLWDVLITSEVPCLIEQAIVLSQQYHVVVTNPPYMGSNNMNPTLYKYVRDHYDIAKSDLFAVFILQCKNMCCRNGFCAMITQHGWMFLGSYEKLRLKILSDTTIETMVHLGAKAFDEITGEVVQTTAFSFCKMVIPTKKGRFCRLVAASGEKAKEHLYLKSIKEDGCFLMDAKTFTKIPNAFLGYWLSEKMIHHLIDTPKVGTYGSAKQGLITSDNDRFLRLWFEVKLESIGKKWFFYNKGGGFRRWYGNIMYVVNWENDGFEICHFVDEKGKLKSRPQNTQYYFKEGLTWNDISTADFCCRKVDDSVIFDASGPTFFLNENSYLDYFVGVLNTSTVQMFMNLICQGLHYSTGHIPQIPIVVESKDEIEALSRENILIVKEEWDSFETSVDFKRHPLI